MRNFSLKLGLVLAVFLMQASAFAAPKQASDDGVCDQFAAIFSLEYYATHDSSEVTKKEEDDYRWRKQFAENPANRFLFQEASEVFQQKLQELRDSQLFIGADEFSDEGLFFDDLVNVVGTQEESSVSTGLGTVNIASKKHRWTEAALEHEGEKTTKNSVAVYGYIDQEEDKFTSFNECIYVNRGNGKDGRIACFALDQKSLVEALDDADLAKRNYAADDLIKRFVGPTPRGMLSRQDYISERLEEVGLYCIHYTVIGAIQKNEETKVAQKGPASKGATQTKNRSQAKTSAQRMS